MKRPFLCALAALLAATGPHAVADTMPATLVASFLHLCGLTRGDGEQALAIADHTGWSRPPVPALHPPVLGSAKWTGLDGRVFHLPSGKRTLVVSAQADPGGRYAHSCSVSNWTTRATSPAGMASIQAALARWVGGDPVEAIAATGYARFAFREVGGERRPLAANDPALSAKIPPADVIDVRIYNTRGNPMIAYMRWR